MKRRIIDFVELKAYIDIFNERGHPGVKETVDPFLWWNFKWRGKVDDMVHAYIDDGLVVVLELENKIDVKNLFVFALCPHKDTLKRILDITRNYGNVIYNSCFRDRYRKITEKLDGACSFSDGRFYYAANGETAWARLARQ